MEIFFFTFWWLCPAVRHPPPSPPRGAEPIPETFWFRIDGLRQPRKYFFPFLAVTNLHFPFIQSAFHSNKPLLFLLRSDVGNAGERLPRRAKIIVFFRSSNREFAACLRIKKHPGSFFWCARFVFPLCASSTPPDTCSQLPLPPPPSSSFGSRASKEAFPTHALCRA